LARTEYELLRQTIAIRGTVRMALVPVTIIVWAGLGVSVLVLAQPPFAALFPLVAIAAGFESILALHIGVERIGRFLQVFYEDVDAPADALWPRWERTAMVGGPALPGGGTDPLFAILFSSAVILNFVLVLVPQPVPLELAVFGALHLVVVIRIWRARRAAATQRAKDLAHYQLVRDQARGIAGSTARPNPDL
jgi:hypothetical protein